MLMRMSTFLFTLLGLTVGSTDPCAIRREIAPCTCRLEEPKLKRVVIACEQMATFADIIEMLGNRFPPEQDISLKINYSRLNDMAGRSFKELGMKVSNLKLTFDNLSHLPESSFTGLGEVEYFSLADNRLLEIPRDVLRKMPKLKTLDLGRSRISSLRNEDFRDLPVLQHLLLPGNLLTGIEADAFPRTMRRMHIGKNSLESLNGSLRGLTDLEWLFINENRLTTLHEQLPAEAPKLNLIHAGNNHLPKLPPELRNYPNIDALFLSFNNLVSIDGVLQKARRLKKLDLSHNKIHALVDDDFAETESMEELQLGYNFLKRLDKTFLPMRKLRILNLTHNFLEEFSFEEIRGLINLQLLDLSHNKIAELTGRKNVVEMGTRVRVLKLEHNEIRAIGGSLLGIRGLQRLDLSHNKLMSIAPDDLIDLEDLRFLDISHNRLTTLEETSKTFLPRLEELIVNNNLLRTLQKDFHGLPVLCKADLSQNQIVSIGMDLVSKTRCKADGIPGVLRIYLYDNPVLCDPEFNVTADYMEDNFAILQGDFTVCPSVVSTTTEKIAAPALAEERPEPIMVPQLLINQQHVPFPLLITPEDKKKEILIGEKAPHFDILSTDFGGKGADANNLTNEEIGPAPVEGNILESVVIHSPIVVNDEGSNVTLFIPVENAAVRQDQVLDQYIQKNEDILNQTSAAGVIDIVEIKQLPKETSPKKGGGEEDGRGRN